jgi:DNA-binding transcriptional MerR regulator
MQSERSFTLSEVAGALDVPQHRLIHLCEKGVVTPEVHDAAGRGSSRVFSTRNVLELAVALRLRDAMLPVAAVGAIVHVLRALEDQLRAGVDSFSLMGNLRSPSPPDFRIIISDGQTIYFSLAGPDTDPQLFGGVRIDEIEGNSVTSNRRVPAVRRRLDGPRPNDSFGGSEHSQFARLELSVTAVAQALPMG